MANLSACKRLFLKAAEYKEGTLSSRTHWYLSQDGRSLSEQITCHRASREQEVEDANARAVMSAQQTSTLVVEATKWWVASALPCSTIAFCRQRTIQQTLVRPFVTQTLQVNPPKPARQTASMGSLLHARFAPSQYSIYLIPCRGSRCHYHHMLCKVSQRKLFDLSQWPVMMVLSSRSSSTCKLQTGPVR